MFESLDGFAQDARYAIRTLRRSPGFTVTAIATLALGIGINAAVFTVTNAVLFKGFRSIKDNHRILYIGTQQNGRGCCVSYPDFADWRSLVTTLEGLGAVADLRIAYSDWSGVTESYSATRISVDGFRLLKQAPILGRDFLPADEAPGATPVAILSYGFWERRYGEDPAIVGRTVRINGASTTVIGVMGPGFSFPQNQELWVPLVWTPDQQRREARDLWFAFGRMADGVTVESAQAELAAIGAQLASVYPQTNLGWIPRSQTFTEFFVGRNADTTYRAMWAAAGFVLLIACANLTNLTFDRAIGRTREIALRLAIGAGRLRIIRQLLIESLMLSACGGAAGWWFAKAAVRMYELVANPPTLSWSEHLLDYTLDGGVFVYVVAISIGAGVLFGIAPALRMSKLDVNTAMKASGRNAAGNPRGARLSGFLVMGEVALAMALLACAGVMLRTFLNIHAAEIGVNIANTLTMLINLPAEKYASADAKISFFDRLETRLASVPGLESITFASALPTGGTSRSRYELAGAPPVDEHSRLTLSALTIAPRYFHTLGAAMIGGREFDDFDDATGVPVAIVNQQFARRHWRGEDPLGKRLRLFVGERPDVWLTVVGVVSNILQNDPGRTRSEFDPLVYLPFRQRPAGNVWVIGRTSVNAGAMGTAFRRELQAVDSDLPVWLGPFTLAERLAGAGGYWATGGLTALFMIFAALALLLASVGLFSVMAHAVSRRTAELGVRLAIGGTASDILALVFMQGMRQVAIGLIIGLAGSLALTRVLSSALVRVSPADPTSLMVAAALLILSAALGCLLPACRAMRIDPVVALKQE